MAEGAAGPGQMAGRLRRPDAGPRRPLCPGRGTRGPQRRPADRVLPGGPAEVPDRGAHGQVRRPLGRTRDREVQVDRLRHRRDRTAVHLRAPGRGRRQGPAAPARLQGQGVGPHTGRSVGTPRARRPLRRPSGRLTSER
ncbi:hypothetical protein SGPA1_12175 [Streptomyces misionensis JCM 4497]